MKADIYWLCAVAFVMIIAEAIVAPAVLFGAPLAGIIFNGYLGLGLGLFFIGSIHERLRRDEQRQALEQQIIYVNRRKQGFARIRGYLYSAMLVVIGVTCWPGMQFGLHSFRIAPSQQRTNSILGLSAGIALFPIETSMSLYVAVAPAILTVIAARSHPPFGFSIKFLWIIVFSIFLKHLVSLVTGDAVQEKLRGGLDPVLLSYALITGGDLIGLILCYNGILNWNAGSVFTNKNAQTVLTQLLALKDLLDAYEHPPHGMIAYCIGISGLLWWLTLAEGLLHFKDYKRQPMDYLKLASACTMLGKDERAGKFLEAAEVSTKDECEAKGQMYAARGDFDKAAMFIRRYLNQTDGAPPTDNYVAIKLWGGLLAFRVGQDRIYQFVDYGAGHGLTDILLADIAMTYCSGGGNARAFADHLGTGSLDRYGLSYLCLKWLADEEREIFDLHRDNEPAEAGADRGLWLCLDAMLWPARRRPAQETERFLQHWTGAALGEIQGIGVAMTDSIDQCALIDILITLQRFWSSLGVELNAIGPVIFAIRQTLPANEVIARMTTGWPSTAPATSAVDAKSATVAPHGAAPIQSAA